MMSTPVLLICELAPEMVHGRVVGDQVFTRLRAVSLFSSVSHVCERASSGEAARRKKQGRQPEKKKERLPAQPEPMKYALASQRKNTIG